MTGLTAAGCYSFPPPKRVCARCAHCPRSLSLTRSLSLCVSLCASVTLRSHLPLTLTASSVRTPSLLVVQYLTPFLFIIIAINHCLRLHQQQQHQHSHQRHLRHPVLRSLDSFSPTQSQRTCISFPRIAHPSPHIRQPSDHLNSASSTIQHTDYFLTGSTTSAFQRLDTTPNLACSPTHRDVPARRLQIRVHTPHLVHLLAAVICLDLIKTKLLFCCSICLSNVSLDHFRALDRFRSVRYIVHLTAQPRFLLSAAVLDRCSG